MIVTDTKAILQVNFMIFYQKQFISRRIFHNYMGKTILLRHMDIITFCPPPKKNCFNMLSPQNVNQPIYTIVYLNKHGLVWCKCFVTTVHIDQDCKHAWWMIFTQRPGTNKWSSLRNWEPIVPSFKTENTSESYILVNFRRLPSCSSVRIMS